MEDDDFYKPKPLKLSKASEEKFKPVEEAPAEPVVQHFKPIKKESPYGPRNLLRLLVPIAVTAALGYGCYKGVVIFRDVSARADAADRDADTASSNLMKTKQELAQYESKASEIDQSLPRLVDGIRREALSKAEAKYRAEIETTLQKTEEVKQQHTAEAMKKQADIEQIAADKTTRAKAAVDKVSRQLEEAKKENDDLKVFLRANNRTQHSSV